MLNLLRRRKTRSQIAILAIGVFQLLAFQNCGSQKGLEISEGATSDHSGAPSPTPTSTPTVPTPTPLPTTVKWQDNLQSETNWLNWGPGFFPVIQWPIGQDLAVLGSDAQGASLSRVSDPAGGGGFALRHYVDPASGGGRAQYSMASWTNAAFGIEAAKGEVWIEWEVYFPVVPTSIGPDAWLSIMDFHSHGPNGEQWWATDGAIMFASQALGGTAGDAGKLRMRDYTNTKFSNITASAIPAGRWVKLLVHYIWSTSEVPITLYIDGVQAMQMSAVTKDPVHTQLEFMVKLYGGNVGTGVWTPNPLVYYSRNVKILSP